METSSAPQHADPAVSAGNAAAENHLRQLAITELGHLREVLTATGEDLDDARSRCHELDDALSATREILSERENDLRETRATLEATRDDLASTIADAERASREGADAAQALKEHIDRLKAQIQRPWRLVAKWGLRRGPYARTARARGR